MVLVLGHGHISHTLSENAIVSLKICFTPGNGSDKLRTYEESTNIVNVMTPGAQGSCAWALRYICHIVNKHYLLLYEYTAL